MKDYKVRWTTIAREHLRETKKYLQEEWGNEVTKNFIKQVELIIERIKSDIVDYPNYEDIEGVKKVNVAKYNTLVFEKNDNIINILGLLNQRKLPENNYNEILNNQERL